MIRAGDRVARVLERDERLVEVFAAASPHFERLRDPGMRRVMARLVTVEQAARVAGVDPDDLLSRLNHALGGFGDAGVPEPGATEVNEEREGTIGAETRTPPPAAIDPERVVDVDVREDLRRGHEPFARIMAAKAALPEGHVLRLRATFEPVPLYHVLGKQGFAHWTERLAEDDWRVWFYREEEGRRSPVDRGPGTGDRGPTTDDPGGQGSGAGDGVVVLDVRGLEPPEPMVRTLAALETLPAGATLVQVNVRVPQFLLPRLDEGGFTYEVREQEEGLVRLFIRRRGGDHDR